MIIVETADQVEFLTMLVKLTLLLFIVAISLTLGFSFGRFYQQVHEYVRLESNYAVDLLELPEHACGEPELAYRIEKGDG